MLFFWTEICVSVNWDERLLEKYMRQWKKMVENQFPPARISSVFKNWFPLIAETVSTCRKKLSSKMMVSIREKNPFFNSRNEGFAQQLVSTRQKKELLQQESLKNI